MSAKSFLARDSPAGRSEYRTLNSEPQKEACAISDCGFRIAGHCEEGAKNDVNAEEDRALVILYDILIASQRGAMSGSVTDTSIIAAALIAQVSVIVIMAVTSALVAVGHHGRGCFAYVVLVLALMTLIPLMFTRGYSATWGPLLGAGDTLGIARSTSMLIVFLANVGAVHVLVWATGGSRVSPFQAVYFLIPTLALFLREPLGHVLLYLSCVITSYSYLSAKPGLEEDRPGEIGIDRFAYWLDAVACLILATYIGFLTRP